MNRKWLVFNNPKARGAFKEALSFAKKNGLRTNLLEQLQHLRRIARNSKGYVRLGKDHSPLSFYWAVVKPDGGISLDGGLIYFGPNDSGVGAPQYTVRIGSNSAGWSIHT